MIESDFFSLNRQKLSESINQGLFIMSAHAQMQRTNDMAYKFEQDANFWWLTGIDAARWLLVIDDNVSYLVMPDMDPTEVIFNGNLIDTEAKRLSGVDEVITFTEYKKRLPELAVKYETVHCIGEDPSAKWHDFTMNPAASELRSTLNNTFKSVQDCSAVLKKLRAIKQDVEIEHIQKAVNVTAHAFEDVRKTINTFRYEYEIEAHFNGEFRRTGLEGHAYDPIVAAAANACTLHYGTNNDKLPENGLVLLDIGAKSNGYAADITRTYAIGTPTDRQIAVHKAVETAHYKIIDCIRPGVSFESYQASVDEIMKDALQEIGLLEDRTDQGVYRKYFPHAVSHGLGLDVHESMGGYKEFMAGMVLTVEPGIYIPEEGIGVRIEDDILVTNTGNKNLSADLPTSL